MMIKDRDLNMNKIRRCLGCMEEYKQEFNICPFCGYEVDTPPKEAYHMVPGTILAGRYIVGRVLGFGGFGVTYIGYDKKLNRKVAMKEYLPGEFSTRIPGQTQVTTYEGEREEQFNSGLEKFLDEARMLAKTQIANGVVQIYDSIHENGTAYIIMEYLEGRTLREYLEENDKLSVEEAKNIILPIMSALSEIHELGIIHRDIAPDNIFLTNDGKVKLLDFGASRFATTSHSKSLSVIIKPGYAPIEQYRSSSDQGTWTDVYSLAATFYKMITGETPEDAMERVEKDELKKPSKMGININRSMENALMNALNIRVEDRTQSIEQLEQELFGDGEVKSRYKKLKKADIGKWPTGVKFLVAIFGTAIIIFSILIFIGVLHVPGISNRFILGEGMTRVPNLVNEEVQQAEALLVKNQLYLQIVDKQYSEYIPMDLVLSQYLDKGEIVSVNNIVEVVVSGGREVVQVPDIRFLDKDEACASLSELGFQIELEEDYSAFAPGVIVTQEPESGAQAYKGDVVHLMVSLGKENAGDSTKEVKIPDLYGLTMEEANEAIEESGLYIKKVGTAPGKLDPGCILEQTPKAGETAFEGDVIEVIVVEAEEKILMPDVQYKDKTAAVSSLEKLGLKVKMEYEESATVAKDKVISQSVAAYTEVKKGQTITLKISKGSEEVQKSASAAGSWSAWTDNKPSNVTADKYDIEEKTVYSYRDQSYTEGYSSEMSGWTLYDWEEIDSGYTEWSNWSTDSPSSVSGRDIESKTQYQYSKLEQFTSNLKIDGYTLVDTATSYGEYGEWSSYSEDSVNASDTTEVRSKTQYSSRTRTTKTETTTSSSSSLDGWTNIGSYNETEWSDKKSYSNTVTYKNGESHESAYDDLYSELNRYDTYEISDESGGTSVGEEYSKEYYSCQYRTGTYHTVYEFQREGYSDYSDWGSWTDDVIESSDTTDVRTRTVYSYRTRSEEYSYTYERWGSWSDWSDSVVSESSTCEVNTRTVYRYRDKDSAVIYYFYKWGNWSDWRDEAPSSSDNREIKKKTMYRYRTKG